MSRSLFERESNESRGQSALREDSIDINPRAPRPRDDRKRRIAIQAGYEPVIMVITDESAASLNGLSRISSNYRAGIREYLASRVNCTWPRHFLVSRCNFTPRDQGNTVNARLPRPRYKNRSWLQAGRNQLTVQGHFSRGQ